MDNICLCPTVVHKAQYSLSLLQMTQPETVPNICWQMYVWGTHFLSFVPLRRKQTSRAEDSSQVNTIEWPHQHCNITEGLFSTFYMFLVRQLNQSGRAANKSLLIKAVKMFIYYALQKICCHVLYLLNVENVLPKNCPYLLEGTPV